MTAKKCTKKRNASAKLLFCQSKPIAFLPFSLPLPLPSSSVKLPKEASNAAEIETVRGGGDYCLLYFTCILHAAQAPCYFRLRKKCTTW